MRTPRQQLYISFAFLCRNLEQKFWVPAPYARQIKDNEYLAPYCCEKPVIGCFFLDYDSCHGGWCVTKLLEGGCQHHPLGYGRLPISKMTESIEFANRVLLFQKHKQPN